MSINQEALLRAAQGLLSSDSEGSSEDGHHRKRSRSRSPQGRLLKQKKAKHSKKHKKHKQNKTRLKRSEHDKIQELERRAAALGTASFFPRPPAGLTSAAARLPVADGDVVILDTTGDANNAMYEGLYAGTIPRYTRLDPLNLVTSDKHARQLADSDAGNVWANRYYKGRNATRAWNIAVRQRGEQDEQLWLDFAAFQHVAARLALLEYHCFPPPTPPGGPAALVRLFSGFWGSAAPRIGEAGARGWAYCAAEAGGDHTEDREAHGELQQDKLESQDEEGEVQGQEDEEEEQSGEADDVGEDEEAQDEEEVDEVELMLRLGVKLEEQLEEVEQQGLPPHILTRWAAEEASRSSSQWQPLRTSATAASLNPDDPAFQNLDPSRVVGFGSLHSCLFILRTKEALRRLVIGCVELLGAPVGPWCSSNCPTPQQQQQGLGNAEGQLAAARAAAKRLLSDEQDNLLLYDAYGCCEAAAGQAKTARKVLESALTLGSATAYSSSGGPVKPAPRGQGSEVVSEAAAAAAAVPLLALHLAQLELCADADSGAERTKAALQARAALAEALQLYPASKPLLALQVQLDCCCYTLAGLRRQLAAMAELNPSPVLWSSALQAEALRPGGRVRMKTMFERALAAPGPLAHYISHELSLGRLENARRVFLRAVHECPGFKGLWLSGFSALSRGMQPRECSGLLNSMQEREVLVRVDVYEVLLAALAEQQQQQQTM
eukprot:gene10037-10193_t